MCINIVKLIGQSGYANVLRKKTNKKTIMACSGVKKQVFVLTL